MVKVKVIKQFRDAEKDKVYKPNDEIELRQERVKEIKDKLPNYIEEVKTKKPSQAKKSTSRKSTSTKKQTAKKSTAKKKQTKEDE